MDALVQLASLGAGVIQNSAGAVVPGAHGTIFLHGTDTPVTIYSDELGSSPNTQGTFTTDPYGRIPGWLAAGQAVDIVTRFYTNTVNFTTLAIDGGSAQESSIDTVDGGSSSGN